MKSPNYLLVVLLLASSTSWAQQRSRAVFLELAGNSPVYSLNYDQRLNPDRQDGGGFRVGLGIVPFGVNSATSGDNTNFFLASIPLAYNYLLGAKRSALEAGLGITPLYANKSTMESGQVISREKDFTAAIFGTIGYRYQPLKQGVHFRLAWTPAYTNEGFQTNWLGLSLGYGFIK